ncbi:hypothetical protein KC480_05315 [Bacillus velezensis]|uniref:hypothetical protein n=1 Tax=Bacillus velezensis TaxID=492670 RepID=UPI001E50E098|nr:hypothetical protein [Bacillus velezensis]MCD7910944.1 hypothetical protein [Bacillus velezensis]
MDFLNNIEPISESRHKSTFNSKWNVHQFDIVMPSNTRGKTISFYKLYFRLANANKLEVKGGFIEDWNGSYLAATEATSDLYEPSANLLDYYLMFDFKGLEIDVPANGVLIFKIEWISGSNQRMDTGSSQYTTTYIQNNDLRLGNTSFAAEYNQTMELKVQVAYSNDGNSFSEFFDIDTINVPQFRYLKIRALFKGGGIDNDIARQTPTLKSIKINCNSLSLEGRLTDLERINAINMAKLNFKSNALLQSEKYNLYDMVVDTFEQDSLILVNENDSENKATLFDKTLARYIGKGTLETTSEEIPSYCKSLVINAEGESFEFEYSLDEGLSWHFATLGNILDIVPTPKNHHLKIKIHMLTDSSVLTALSYAWA